MFGASITLISLQVDAQKHIYCIHKYMERIEEKENEMKEIVLFLLVEFCFVQ